MSQNGRTDKVHIYILSEGEQLEEVQGLLADGTALQGMLEKANGGSGGQKREEGSSSRYLRRVPIRLNAGEILYIDTQQIDWVEAADQYVRLHTQGRQHLLRESMRQMERQLDPKCFFRIHRSAIVNLSRVKKLRVDSPTLRWVILEDGTRLRANQGSWERLQQALTWYPQGGS